MRHPDYLSLIEVRDFRGTYGDPRLYKRPDMKELGFLMKESIGLLGALIRAASWM